MKKALLFNSINAARASTIGDSAEAANDKYIELKTVYDSMPKITTSIVQSAQASSYELFKIRRLIKENKKKCLSAEELGIKLKLNVNYYNLYFLKRLNKSKLIA